MRVCISMSPETHQRLRCLAHHLHIPASELVRQWIDHSFKFHALNGDFGLPQFGDPPKAPLISHDPPK